MKPLLPILLFLSLQHLLAAQPAKDTTGQHSLIKGLVRYRDEIILRNPAAFNKLWTLDTLWKEQDKEALADFVLHVVYAHEWGYKPEKITKLFHKEKPDFRLPHLLNMETIQTVVDNHELLGLLNEDIVKPKPPFLFNPYCKLFDELAFYKVRNGMRVAELGAGNGVFSLVLGLAYDSLTVYVNELDQYTAKGAVEKILKCGSIRPNNQFVPVNGKKKSTELEPGSVDKIIIRNSFHHFSHKSEMLASIKESLAPGGDLLIIEPLSVDAPGECPVMLTRDELRKVLTENGFRVVEEKMPDYYFWVMLRCQPI
jgi:SAM-dependent methyltransferase